MAITFSNDWFETRFSATPVMAILRGMGVERSIELAARAWDLGITAVELPIQTETDIRALREVAAAGLERGHPVGAGTVIRAEQVEVALAAGAAFTVSPGLDPVVVEASLDVGLPTLPGVATATEIQAAMRLGLSWFKAFPASELTPSWISAMHGPFPDARFVATGGITTDNASAFLEAGCRGVAIGSALADPAQLDRIAALVPRPHGSAG